MNPDKEFELSKAETDDILKRWTLFCNVKFDNDITSEEMPKFADSDYKVLFDGKLHHFVEVKKRRNTSTKYEYTKIPLRKHAVAEHYFANGGIKTYFIAIFTDCVGIFKIYKEPDQIVEMVARHDRGNDKDIYALYSVKNMTKLL